MGDYPSPATPGARVDLGLASGLLIPGNLQNINTDGAVNVRWFGAVGDGVTDDSTAVATALSVALSEGRCLYFPWSAGAYLYGTTITVAQSRTGLLGDPGARIKFTGTGACVLFDGTAETNGLTECIVRNLEIEGTTTATYGLHLKKCGHSLIENVRVFSVATAGFYSQFGIANTYVNPTVSVNEGAFSILPTYGMEFTRLGVGEDSNVNLVISPVMEGLTAGVGLYADHAFALHVVGGTSESNNTGALLTGNGGWHVIDGLWGEDNAADDISCDSYFCDFRSFLSDTRTRFLSSSYACVCRSSVHYGNILIDSGARGIVLDRVMLAGTLTDSGTGTIKTYWDINSPAWH